MLLQTFAGRMRSVALSYFMSWMRANCHPDVFLVCEGPSGSKFFQIWVNKKDQGFEFAMQRSLPAGTQSISFADIGTVSARLYWLNVRQLMAHLQIVMGLWICCFPAAPQSRRRLALDLHAPSTSHTTGSFPSVRLRRHPAS